MAKKRMDVAKFNTNTARINAWAEKKGLEVISFNNAIQLRIQQGARTVEFYPSTGRVVGGGKVQVLPVEKKGFTKAMNSIFPTVKRKDAKCSCITHYSHEDGVFCLHKLFSKGYVEMLTRTENMYGKIKFELWSDWRPRYMNGSRWRLRDTGEIQLAIELAKQYNVPMQRL